MYRARLRIDFLAWYSNLHVVEQCILNHPYGAFYNYWDKHPFKKLSG